MIFLDSDVLVIDRTEQGEDSQPFLHVPKRGRGGGWYIELRPTTTEVLHYLIDAEIVGESLAIRYIARDGQQFTATAIVANLISGPEDDVCLLHGQGTAPPAFLADAPEQLA